MDALFEKQEGIAEGTRVCAGDRIMVREPFDLLVEVWQELRYGFDIDGAREEAERMVEDFRASDHYRLSELLGRVHDAQRLPVLWALWRLRPLRGDELNILLSVWWSTTETPFLWFAEAGIDTAEIVAMFRAADFVSDTDEIHHPDEPVVVYRGCGREGTRGLSWTLSEETAAEFARLESQIDREGVASVYSATVAPESILGIFFARGEEEILVDPAGIGDVRRLYDVRRDVQDINRLNAPLPNHGSGQDQ